MVDVIEGEEDCVLEIEDPLHYHRFQWQYPWCFGVQAYYWMYKPQYMCWCFSCKRNAATMVTSTLLHVTIEHSVWSLTALVLAC